MKLELLTSKDTKKIIELYKNDEVLKYLANDFKGLLLINSNLVPKENLVLSHLQKISIRMLKNDI